MKPVVMHSGITHGRTVANRMADALTRGDVTFALRLGRTYGIPAAFVLALLGVVATPGSRASIVLPAPLRVPEPEPGAHGPTPPRALNTSRERARRAKAGA